MTVWGNEKHWERKYWKKIFEDCTKLLFTTFRIEAKWAPIWNKFIDQTTWLKTKFVKANKTENGKIQALCPK